MSTTVDSKVVELSLENGKFESNAQKSLSTIDKLKQSLDFTSNADGLENIGSSLKNINFNVLSKGIEAAKRGFSSLDAIAYGALFRIGQKVTDLTGQLITAVPQQIISGGKRRAMNIEQAKFQLKGLKVAWEDIVGDIDYAVTDTAYGLDEAAKVASQLVASSVQLGDPMKKALRGISGVAAMTNSSYEEIGHVFTTVAGQGRLMAEQLNSLAARGLNVAAVMGESMGKTEAEIREMVSKGKIDFATFAAAMDDAFGEHATSANETFSGVFSNIKANLSKIGELFAIPAYEGLKRVFNGLLPLIKDVRIELTPLSKDFETVFLAICDGIAAAFDTIHAAFKGDNRSIGEIIRDHFFPESKEVKKEGEKTVTAVEGIHDKALAVIRDYNNLAKFGEEGYDTQQIQDYVNLLYKLTNGTWNITDAILAEADAQMNITETAEEATEATKEVTDSAEEMTEQYDDAYASMSNAELGVLGIAQIMQGINYAIAMIGQEFEGVFSADKNELVRNAMVAFEDLSKAFRNFSFKHGENIAKILHGLYSGFKIVADVVWMVIRIIGKAFSIVWDAFGDDIMNFLGWVGQGITKVQEWMETHEVFQKVVDGVSNTFRTAVETVRSWIDAFLAMPEVQATIEKFKHAFDLVFDDFSGLLHETGDAFKTFFGDILDAFGVLNTTKDPQKFLDALGEAFNNLGKFFSEQDWFQAFQDAFGSVGDIFDALGESFTTWLDGFRADMEGTLVGDILDWIIEKLGKVKKFIKSIFGIGGDADDATEGLGEMEESSFSFGTVLGWIGGFIGDFVNTLLTLPWGKIAKFAGIAATVYKVYRAIRSIWMTITAPLNTNKSINRFINSLSGTLESTFGFGMGGKWKTIRKNLYAVAITIGILVACITVISRISAGNIAKGILVIGLLGGLMLLMLWLLKLMTRADDFKRDPAKGLVAAAISIFILSLALAKIAKIDEHRLWPAVGALAVLALIIGLLGAALGFISIINKHGQKNTGALIAIAAGLYVAVLALSNLAKIPSDKLWGSLFAIAVLGLILVAITTALAGAQYLTKSHRVSWGTIVGIAIGLFIAAKALQELSKIDQSRLLGASIAMTWIAILLVGMTALGALISKIKGVKGTNWFSMIAAAVALFIVAKALQEVAKIEPDRLEMAATVLGIMGLLLAVMVFLGSLSSGLDGVKGSNWLSVVGMAAALFIVAKALQEVGKIEPDRLEMAATVLGIIGLLLAAMVFLGSLASALPGVKGSGWLDMIGMAAALYLAAKALQQVAEIDPGRLDQATFVLGVLGVILAGMVDINKVVSSVTGVASSSWGPVIAMAGSLYLAAKALQEVAEIDSTRLDQATFVLGVLGVILAGMVDINKVVSSVTGPAASSEWFAVIAMAAALYIAAKALQKVAEIDSNKLLGATIATIALGGVLVAMVYLSGLVTGFTGLGILNWLSVVAMAAALYIAAKALQELAKIDESKLSGALFALGIVAAIMVAMLYVTSLVAGSMVTAVPALSSLIIMALVVAVIAVVLAALSSLKNVDKMFSVAESLVLVLGGMALVLGILAGIGPAAVNALPGLGIIALVVAGIGVIFGLLGALLPEGAESAILRGVEIVKTIVSGIGEIIASLISGFLGETARGLNEITPALDAFVDVMKKIDSIDIGFENYDNLVNAITTAANAGLGIAFNNWISSIITGDTATGNFSSALTDLSTALTDWQTAMEGIGEIVIPEEGINRLSEIIDSLQYDGAGEVIAEGASRFIAGRDKVQKLNEDTSLLCDAITTWTSTLSTLEGDLDSLPGAGEIPVIDDLTAIIDSLQYESVEEAREEGQKTKLAGGKDKVEKLNEDTTLLAGAIEIWVSSLSGIQDQVAGMLTTEEIGGIISDIQGLIEPFEYKDTGEAFEAGAESLLSLGKDRVEDFSKDAEALSSAIATWATNMDGIVLKKETIPKAEDIQAIVDAINAVPKESLWTAIGDFFTGKTNLEEFGTNAEDLGAAITKFSDALGENIDPDKMMAATAVAEQLGILVGTLANANVNGTGTGQLTAFGLELSEFGTNVSEFASSISNLDDVTEAATAASDIATAATTLAELDFSGDLYDDSKVASLKTNIDTLVSTFTGLNGQDFSGVDRLKEAVEKMNETEISETPEISIDTSSAEKDMGTSGTNMGAALTSGFSEGAAGLASSAGDIAAAAAEAVKGAANQFSHAGIWLMSNLALGMLSNASAVTSAASSVASSASSSASGSSGGAYEAGANWARGYANGINEWTFYVRAAAAQAVRSAIAAANEAQDSGSPSRIAYVIGKWFDQGYANGITHYAYLASNASDDMVSGVREGLERSVATITSIITDEMDTTPTITPVLDLSEIQNGAAAIGDMLDSTMQIGAGAPAIDRSLSQRVTTSDVVDALDLLGATLGAGAGGGDTYVVNGVTYDDGTNVANAVGSLVRAIKMGRRA